MTTFHFIELGAAYLLAVMMPGPSITLIIKNGILYSRAASIQAGIGTILGSAIQSGLVLVGLTFIDGNSIFLKIIKILCSLYLIYLGLKIFLSKSKQTLESNETLSGINNLKYWSYFLESLLVEFLNPLAFTFFISIMTVIINTQDSCITKIAYWVEIVTLSSIWFLTVAFISSAGRFTFYARRFNRPLEIIAGSIFILFGSKMFI